MHHGRSGSGAVYPTLLPHSLKFYPIVQLAPAVRPDALRSWPPAPQTAVLDWASRMPSPAEGDQIYIHVPFCPFLCHFCPLYKVEQTGDRAAELKSRFVQALPPRNTDVRELAVDEDAAFHRGVLGGGTPTELSLRQLSEVLRALRDCLPIAPDAEITLEGVITRLKQREFLDECVSAGFNRVSFGVQTLDPDLRRQIGRGDVVDDYEAFLTCAARSPVCRRTSTC